MASVDWVVSNFDRLIDDSYEWYWQNYAIQPVVYPRVCDMTPPDGFDPTKDHWRGTCGVVSQEFKYRKELEEIEYSGGFEDYDVQIVRREISTGGIISDELLRQGDRAVVNFMQKKMQKAAEGAAAFKDAHVADIFRLGVLTTPTDASKQVFVQTIVSANGTFVDPVIQASGTAGHIYDNVPFFDTAHPQSSAVTGTTYSNHDSTLACNLTDIQSAYTTMTTTNAYDRNGDMITINPNQFIINPALHFTLDQILGSEVIDADQQKNTVASMGWEIVEWRRLTDSVDSSTDGLIMCEARKDVKFIEWGSPKIEIWRDQKTKVNLWSFQDWFGAGPIDWRHSYNMGFAAA